MVKIIYGITRKAGLSVAEFQRYWRETHGPIAGKIPGLRRYVQCHTLPELYERGDPPPYDGAAELWFDDMDALRKAMASPETEAAREDERNFIDHSKVFFIVTEEKPVVEA
ncbi:MAG: EthD domain-containing protein [Chloroflexi bacterium]|nr:EthD domain-containing protein [Chloroflexota bacterium]